MWNDIVDGFCGFFLLAVIALVCWIGYTLVTRTPVEIMADVKSKYDATMISVDSVQAVRDSMMRDSVREINVK